MTWDVFERWSPHSVRGAAAQLVASGLLSEPEATSRAREQLAGLLPAGIATPLHRLCTVRSTDARGPLVGYLWWRVRPESHAVEAFVLDVEILPRARGRGLGRATMLAVEQAAREDGASVLRLNVFAHNTAAVRLYEGLGYDVVGSTMTWRVDGPSQPARAGPPLTQGPVELRPMPAPEHWTAFDGTDQVAHVWLRLAQRSDGRHAFLQELEVIGDHRDHVSAVVRAVQLGCRSLEATTLTVALPGSLPGSLPGGTAGAQTLMERCGLRVAARTLATPLERGRPAEPPGRPPLGRPSRR